MPRPKLSEANRKSRTIIYRVTDADYVRLDRKAAAGGMTVNDLARMLTLSREALIRIETYEKADPALIKRFDRLANNLNQLAKNSHIFGRVSPQLDELCEQITDLVCDIAEKELRK